MRRTTRFLATATVLWTVLGVGGPAAAGGWWSGIPLESPVLGGGGSFQSGPGEVLFDGIEAAERARQGVDRYYAYLIPDLDWSIVDEAMSVGDPGDWWIRPASAIRAGEVDVWGGSSNLARIRVAFDVPEIQPGRYALMLCSDGCAQSLADIVPSEISLVDDLVTAQLAKRATRLEERFRVWSWGLGRRVDKLERQLETAREPNPGLVGALEDASERVRALERRVAELEGAAPALAWLVVGAAGAALLILLPRRRRPRERPPTPPRVVEMELVEPPEMEPEPDPDRTPVPAA